jgi:peptidyl-prolyl cis-trans isomerase A (cyclophilin A)
MNLRTSLATFCLVSSTAQAGIFADFITSTGTFTIELDALNAPRAVANFLGLVDGEQTWRDPVTGTVRGGSEGDRYFDGMRFYSKIGSLALLGGLRSYPGSGGNELWEGPGYTILDDATNGIELVRGVLAMAAFEGPHSGGGELAVVLSDAMTNSVHKWTGFGQVTEGGMAVAEAIVHEIAEGSGQVAVQIVIRDEDITPAETAALAAARNDLPVVEEMPLGLSRDSNGTMRVSFWSKPHSQACLSTTTNLLATRWSVLPGSWNAATNAAWNTWSVTSIPGLGQQEGFLYGSQAVYPKMTVTNLFSGLKRLGVAHTGVNMQYWLDFEGKTGMWARVEGGVPVENGALVSIIQQRETAYSVIVGFAIGLTGHYYWLGFDETGHKAGRFYYEEWEFNAYVVNMDAGTFVYEDGWGD